MNYRIIISDNLRKTLAILKRKDTTMFQMVEKKIMQIAYLDSVSIQHFKNLRSPLSDYKRVHLGSYVLLFHVQANNIIFDAFEHHDKIYHQRQ
ncbi:MAG: addiction module toxin RelE [Candidatus Thermoplasmatota archaeon]|jgi:mRNA-degrading endonuclease RelE of RelBE toxin-antitoxin system|nr:addiction module toxin RelE [Candidatus Thermoplasmatota archaeon]